MQNKFNMYGYNDQVWCFQAPGVPNSKGILKIEKAIETFISEWESHGKKVNARFTLWKGQILVVHTETQDDTSGCSKDSLFQVVKNLLFKTGLDFLDRDHILWFNTSDIKLSNLSDLESLAEDESILIQTSHKDDFRNLVAQGKITPETLVIDTTIHTGQSIHEASLVKLLKDSWHSQAFL